MSSPKVHISVLPFGTILSETEGDIILSDAGDIKLAIETADGQHESFCTVDPDTAEAIAENLLVAVVQARRLITENQIDLT
jgi:hypothetical protein